MEWNIIIISSVVSERDVSSSAPSRRRRTPPRANAIEDAHPDPPPPPTHTPTHPRVVDPQNSHTPRRPTIRYIHAKPSTRCDRTCGTPPARARCPRSLARGWDGTRRETTTAGSSIDAAIDRARWRLRRLRRSIDRVESSRRSGAVVRGRSIDESKNQRTNRIDRLNRDRSSWTTTTTVTRGDARWATHRARWSCARGGLNRTGRLRSRLSRGGGGGRC